MQEPLQELGKNLQARKDESEPNQKELEGIGNPIMRQSSNPHVRAAQGGKGGKKADKGKAFEDHNEEKLRGQSEGAGKEAKP